MHFSVGLFAFALLGGTKCSPNITQLKLITFISLFGLLFLALDPVPTEPRNANRLWHGIESGVELHKSIGTCRIAASTA